MTALLSILAAYRATSQTEREKGTFEELMQTFFRIPAVKIFADSPDFSQAGRNLAHWHLNYETVAQRAGVTLDTVKSPANSLPAQARPRMGHGTPIRQHRPSQRHHQRRQSLSHRNHGQSQIPFGTPPKVVNGLPKLDT